MALRQLEDNIGRRLGDRHDPLLVSVRSGAKFSMPGMMETVLNIGLNDASVKGLAEESGDERFAWDSYRRLLQMFGKTVLEMPGEVFSDALDKAKSTKGVQRRSDLDVDDLKVAGDRRSRTAIREHSGQEFPQHPREQLDMAIHAVFDSWNTDRARLYRRRERIPQNLGTAVNICTMVFGNLGRDQRHRRRFHPGPGVRADRRVRRLPVQRAGRGRRRRHPQHAVAGRSARAGPGLAQAADEGDAPAGDALPGPVRHRVHHRARQAVDAADPGRQAHRRRGLPDRRTAGRRDS